MSLISHSLIVCYVWHGLSFLSSTQQRGGVQELLDDAERTLKFVIETEEKIPLDTVENFDETLADIKAKLIDLRDNLVREEMPIIYHLDVGAMYPNIILTNRLQVVVTSCLVRYGSF